MNDQYKPVEAYRTALYNVAKAAHASKPLPLAALLTAYYDDEFSKIRGTHISYKQLPPDRAHAFLAFNSAHTSVLAKLALLTKDKAQSREVLIATDLCFRKLEDVVHAHRQVVAKPGLLLEQRVPSTDVSSQLTYN